jgi:hypothetical protein
MCPPFLFLFVKLHSQERYMVKLRSLRLVHCQSLKDVYYEFVDGLNVIIAENNTGKSVKWKMLKIACDPKVYSKEEMNELIMRGKDYAEATYIFEDHSCGIVRVYKDKPIYYYSADHRVDGSFVASLEPDEIFIRNLSVIIDPESHTVINILDLDQSLFMVNGNSKTTHNMLDLITNDPKLNRIIGITAEKTLIYRNKLKSAQKVYREIQTKVATYDYVDLDSLNIRIQSCKAALRVYEVMVDLAREMSSASNYVTDEEFYDTQIRLCDLAITGREFSEQSSGLFIKEFDEDKLKVIDMYEEFSRVYESLKESNIQYNPEAIDIMDIFLSFYEVAASITPAEEIEQSLFSALDLLEVSREVFRQVQDLGNFINVMKESEVDIKQLNETINELGLVVPCPIYGMVTHVDGECIPHSE